MGQGTAQQGGGADLHGPRDVITKTYQTSIGRVMVTSDWPALYAMFDTRCVWRELEQDREVVVDIHLVPAREALAYRDSESRAPDAQPRKIPLLDAGFSVAREHITGMVPDHTFGGGLLLEWLWRALPTLCAPEGWEAVHAAAVERDGEATLLLGESGAGKTTALLSFLSHGYALLADDVVLVHPERGLVRGWEAAVRLWPDQAKRWGVVASTLDFCGKVLSAPPGVIVAREGEVPLGHCLVLADDGEEVELSHEGDGFDSVWRPRAGAKEWLLARAERLGQRPSALPIEVPRSSLRAVAVAVCTPFAGKHEVLDDWLAAFDALGLPDDAAVLWCCNTEDEAFWEKLQAAAERLNHDVILWRDTHRIEVKDHQVAYLWQQIRSRIPEGVEFVLCLEDDVLPEANALPSLVAVQQRFGEDSVVALPVPYFYPRGRVSHMVWEVHRGCIRPAPTGALPGPVDLCAFGCTLFPRKMLDAISLLPDRKGRAAWGYDQVASEEVRQQGGQVIACWGLHAAHRQESGVARAVMETATARPHVVCVGDGPHVTSARGWEVIGERAAGPLCEVARSYPSAEAMLMTEAGVRAPVGYLQACLDHLQRRQNAALAHGLCLGTDGRFDGHGMPVLRASLARDSGAADLAEFRRYARSEGYQEACLSHVSCYGDSTLCCSPFASARDRAAFSLVMVNRDTLRDPDHNSLGGDLIQLDSWRAHLPHYGIAADARVAGWRDFEAWDLIFLAHAQFEWAKELLQEDIRDKPLIVAAITHGRPEAEVVAPAVYRAAKVICYAEAEADFYRETFPALPADRFVVLPMGVPAGLYDYCARKHGEPRSQSVFMAARYDAHKNQESVLRVCMELDVPVTFAGPLNQGQPNYPNRLREIAAGWDGITLKPMLHGEALWEEYRRAHVHVNACHFEPFGLTTWEALAAGCNIVHTTQGWAADDFGRLGSLCDPNDLDTIGAAIQAELCKRRPAYDFHPPTWAVATGALAGLVEGVLTS